MKSEYTANVQLAAQRNQHRQMAAELDRMYARKRKPVAPVTMGWALRMCLTVSLCALLGCTLAVQLAR